MKNTDFIYPLNNFPYYQNIITINYYYYIKHSLNDVRSDTCFFCNSLSNYTYNIKKHER